jgi:hypothetical protein
MSQFSTLIDMSGRRAAGRLTTFEQGSVCRETCTDDIEKGPHARRPLEVGVGHDPELERQLRHRVRQSARKLGLE